MLLGSHSSNPLEVLVRVLGVAMDEPMIASQHFLHHVEWGQVASIEEGGSRKEVAVLGVLAEGVCIVDCVNLRATGRGE